MGWYGLDWHGSELGLVEGSCEHGNEPLSSCTTSSFSIRARLHGVLWLDFHLFPFNKKLIPASI
jgi:hypothetical protein